MEPPGEYSTTAGVDAAGLREIRSQGNSKLDEASAWSRSQGRSRTLSSRNNAKASLQSGRFRRGHDAIRSRRGIAIISRCRSRWERRSLRAPAREPEAADRRRMSGFADNRKVMK